MRYIERHVEQLIKRLNGKKDVLILTGSRQVGKSTMLRMSFKEHEYVTLDIPSVFVRAKESPLAFVNQFDKVIIDEIQKAPELFHYIKAEVDEAKFRRLESGAATHGARFILTGSQIFGLMENVTESLTGRAAIIQMCGLSKRELNGSVFVEPFVPTLEQLLKKKKNVVPYDYKNIIETIHKGSYPELYQSPSDLTDWKIFFDSYIKTYIEKDVRRIANIQSEVSFMKFLRATAARTGEQLNLTGIAEVVGKDVMTIKHWLSILQTSGLVYLLEPYYNNFNKRLVKTPKLYFMDTGLACYLCGWNTPEQLTTGAVWGHIFETWVVSEVIKSYYNDGRTLLPLYYYRDKEKREVNLIIEESGTLYPVEIKTTSDPNKALINTFNVLQKIPDRQIGEGAVICLCKDILPLSDNNRAIPVDMI